MIAESTLPLGQVLGQGGFADTLEVTRPVRRDLPAELAYKRWRSGASAQEVAHVERLVEFRAQLSAADRDYLDRVAAWPLEMVHRGGGACGFLMPLAPAEFLYVDAARGRIPAAVNLLFAKAQRGRRAGARVPADGDVVCRLVIVAQLAHTLAWLHTRGAIFGDLSQSNELFTVDGLPRIYLIDIDGVSIPTSRVDGANTPNYFPPEFGGRDLPATLATDVYKFTLLLVRILAQPRQQLSQTASPDFLVGRLDAEGLALVTRGLAPDPGTRPTASEFYEYLYRFVGSLLSPPAIASVQLVPEFVTAGDSFRAVVDAPGARQVTVRTSDGSTRTVTPAGQLAQVDLVATVGGTVRVEAVNDHGTVVDESALLRVLPPIQPPHLSRVGTRPIHLTRPVPTFAARELRHPWPGIRPDDVRGLPYPRRGAPPTTEYPTRAHRLPVGP